MRHDDDVTVPTSVLRLIGGLLIGFSLLLIMAFVVEALQNGKWNGGWESVTALSAITLILLFFGVVLAVDEKSNQRLWQLFYFAIGIAATAISIALILWIILSILILQLMPINNPISLLVLFAMTGLGFYWLRRAITIEPRVDRMKRNKVHIVPDHIWLSRQAKWNGIEKQVREQLSSRTSAIILVAHFSDVLSELEIIAANFQADLNVVAVLASSLRTDVSSAGLLDASTELSLIVGERHPQRDHDDAVVRFAEEHDFASQIVFHLSLQDPLLVRFGGGVEEMLRQLGMKEDEAISSGIVARSVKGAQQKLTKMTFADAHASSAEEWIEKNIH